MGPRMPKDMQHSLTDTPELCGDSLAFMTRERREWLAGRYISCEFLLLAIPFRRS